MRVGTRDGILEWGPVGQDGDQKVRMGNRETRPLGRRPWVGMGTRRLVCEPAGTCVTSRNMCYMSVAMFFNGMPSPQPHSHACLNLSVLWSIKP